LAWVEAEGELFGAGGGGQEEFIDERGDVLRCGRGEAVETGGEPCLRGDGDLGATAEDGSVDAVGGVLGGCGDDGGGGG